MLVKEVMTSAPISCGPDDSVEHVASLMFEFDCGAIPVCDSGRPVGMITDRDITCRAVAKGKVPAATVVREIMTAEVNTIGQGEDVEAAIELMKTRQVRRLPVVSQEGLLVGIVAPSDLAPTFASHDVSDFLLAVSYWTRRPANGARRAVH